MKKFKISVTISKKKPPEELQQDITYDKPEIQEDENDVKIHHGKRGYISFDKKAIDIFEVKDVKQLKERNHDLMQAEIEIFADSVKNTVMSQKHDIKAKKEKNWKNKVEIYKFKNEIKEWYWFYYAWNQIRVVGSVDCSAEMGKIADNLRKRIYDNYKRQFKSFHKKKGSKEDEFRMSLKNYRGSILFMKSDKTK